MEQMLEKVQHKKIVERRRGRGYSDYIHKFKKGKSKKSECGQKINMSKKVCLESRVLMVENVSTVSTPSVLFHIE